PPQVSGYLLKKAKTGKWQRRWFETQAHFLTYYKTKKMEKLLAALNLPQVGDIRLVDPDPNDPENDGCLFTIELNERVYTMKAPSREEAARWVEVLRVLQSLETDEARNAMESPSASMVRSQDGAERPNGGAEWKKEGCFGGLCSCLQSS
ncbi:unnamed protein product, partial [Phaeothamnion confervicola]